jgi:hypothetical protein
MQSKGETGQLAFAFSLTRRELQSAGSGCAGREESKRHRFSSSMYSLVSDDARRRCGTETRPMARNAEKNRWERKMGSEYSPATEKKVIKLTAPGVQASSERCSRMADVVQSLVSRLNSTLSTSNAMQQAPKSRYS